MLSIGLGVVLGTTSLHMVSEASQVHSWLNDVQRGRLWGLLGFNRQAYERTGRILNVSVIPFDTHSPPKVYER